MYAAISIAGIRDYWCYSTITAVMIHSYFSLGEENSGTQAGQDQTCNNSDVID